jgi:hypothetical protein
MDNTFFTLQIILTSLVGGIVRYLVEFLKKAQSIDKLSWGILLIHAIVGMFSGYMSFLLISIWSTAEIAGLMAAGLGSFGSYGILFWMLERAQQKLVMMDPGDLEKFKSLKDQDKKNDTDVASK